MSESEPTVFIVDDDEPARRHCEAILRHAGFHTQQFSGATEFLNAYQPHTPGCLVLDVCMPERSGLELQEELSQRQETLPVIFLTNAWDPLTLAKRLRHSAVDYLAKPVSRKDLLDRVQRALATM